MASSPTVDITARCLCKARSITASVPASSLPLAGTYCHCTSCRHMTGALHSSSVKWPAGGGDDGEGNAAVRALGLREYDFSPRLKILFCGDCGTPMFWDDGEQSASPSLDAAGGDGGGATGGGGNGDGGFEAFMGVLSNNDVPGGLIRVRDHIFVGDTLDGGAAVWMRHLFDDSSSSSAPGSGDDDAVAPRASSPIPCYAGWRDKSEPVDPAAMAAAAQARDRPAATAATPDDDIIPVHCRCRGVDLVLRRAAAVDDFSAVKDASQLPFFVDPASHKLLAGFDACDSCRTASGAADIVNWTFTLLKHLDFAPSAASSSSSSSSAPGGGASRPFPGSSLDLKAAVSAAPSDRDPRLGTLAYYASSPDVQRYFCSRCSASVFYAVDDRPDMVDLAVGLLDAPDGARAESVLSWALGDMILTDDLKGGWREELGRSIKRNAEDWRISSGRPVPWVRKLKEQKSAQEKAAADAANVAGTA
ncbi:hypothetical protein JDV02_001681 [Purpureocillium takamizusanense]|uniref:CENP-V/GFA domain-containing protein n=1 Tax=Purpureocillium takamizusanense TaxID=2060973 RepID=A0A9Q8Q8T1_9HYPO|nr:uncharacterized protein JDV02_001681 [Purpureocillium takamizusanense]UNI15115.1 hypothetical protein JDV02_001681 [Purpureocillium takamizusanense]